MKQIWLPKTETNVTVRDGIVTVTDSMKMNVQNVQAQKPGFTQSAPESGRDNV